mmetsp:Transcript_49644/g.82648  ORF Transcript_49644/g.82648 Transcript_49644/m.82648 type:complete len:370 (+) Transcript_49644:348-1457(+)
MTDNSTKDDTTKDDTTKEDTTKDDTTNDDTTTETKQSDEDGIGWFQRPTITDRFYYGLHQESTLVELEGVQACNGSILIECLTGIGSTSTICGAHIIGALSLPCVAVFISPSLPAMTSIHKHCPTSAIRIYGDASVCVAISDHALNASEQNGVIWQICQSLMDFAQRRCVTHIISVDGFPIKDNIQRRIDEIAKKAQTETQNRSDSSNDAEEKTQKLKDEKVDALFSTVRYLSTDKEIAEQLHSKGHTGIKTMQIMGGSGAMMQLAFCSDMFSSSTAAQQQQKDAPPIAFTAMFAPDPVHIPDRRGAVLVVTLLREIWKLQQISVDALQKDANRLQKKVQETVDQIASQMEQQRRIQLQKSAAPAHMYM